MLESWCNTKHNLIGNFLPGRWGSDSIDLKQIVSWFLKITSWSSWLNFRMLISFSAKNETFNFNPMSWWSSSNQNLLLDVSVYMYLMGPESYPIQVNINQHILITLDFKHSHRFLQVTWLTLSNEYQISRI